MRATCYQCRDVLFLNDCVGEEVATACAQPETGISAKNFYDTPAYVSKLVFLSVQLFLLMSHSRLLAFNRQTT